MPLSRYWLLPLIISLCYWQHCFARELLLSGTESSTNVVPFLDFFCEAEGAAPRDLRGAQQAMYMPILGDNIAFTYKQSPCWFRFRLSNRTNAIQNMVLEIPFSLLDDIHLFVIDQQQQVQEYRAGDNLPYNQRPLLINNPVFTLVIPTNTSVDYYLRVQTTSPFAVPVRLSVLERFISQQSNYQLAIGVLYGITFGLLLYNCALWLLTRERSQLLYVGYLASCLVYFLWVHGLLFRFWPNATDWNNHGFYGSILLTVSLGLLFTREYLQLRARPRLDFGFIIFICLTLLLTVVQFAVPLAVVARIAPVLTLFLIVLTLYAGYLRCQDKLHTAPLFVMAWSCLLLAALYTIVMNNLGMGDITRAIDAMQTGFALQQVLLSIGIAQQMNALKEAKARHEQESRIAKAESNAKSEFLARMSHEIRTPMNAVLGITQLLSDSSVSLTKEQQQQIALLYSSGVQLLELINNILDFSRINADKLSLEEVNFDLPSLLAECVNLFQITAQQKSLILVYDAPDDLPQWLMGDPVRLRQILFNLLANALKFTPKGYVRLSVQILKQDTTQCQLKFTIQDSGIGMSAEQIERLFTAFTQADMSITRQYGGSGLGLAICKQLAELMGGTIGVISEPSSGSTFSFDVTLKCGMAPEAVAKPIEDASARLGLAQLRILVAEDSHINQVVIRTMLQRLAINPVIVGNGLEAISLLTSQHEHFDLVLMDYEMPIQDGLVTVRQLRLWEQEHQQPRLPVIALTAHALPQYEQLCREAGMDGFLSKPIMMQQLFAKLEQFRSRAASE